MVRKNKKQKYITRIGQKTGISKDSKRVQPRATPVAHMELYQNLNSGRRRMNGLNSSSGPPLAKLDEPVVEGGEEELTGS